MSSTTSSRPSSPGPRPVLVAALSRDHDTDRAACLPILFRFAAYTLVLFATLGGLLRLIMSNDGVEQRVFQEGGTIEQIQIGVVLVITGVLATAGWRWRRSAVTLWPMAGLAGVAVVRELDGAFDHWLPTVGWPPFAGVILAVVAAMVFRTRGRFWGHLRYWLHTPAFGLLWAGAAVILIFAQLIGQADLWQSVMGDVYERAFKRTVEESSELFGYMLLLIGAIEATWHAPRLDRHDRPR